MACRCMNELPWSTLPSPEWGLFRRSARGSSRSGAGFCSSEKRASLQCLSGAPGSPETGSGPPSLHDFLRGTPLAARRAAQHRPLHAIRDGRGRRSARARTTRFAAGEHGGDRRQHDGRISLSGRFADAPARVRRSHRLAQADGARDTQHGRRANRDALEAARPAVGDQHRVRVVGRCNRPCGGNDRTRRDRRRDRGRQ